MIDGYLKLMYPNGEFTKEELEEIIQIALEMRRRVKEQLKKLGGMEFYDVNFSYIDLEDMSEHYVSVPEQGGGKLIPDGMCNPGQIYTVSRGKSGMIGVFRLESQMLPGNGKIERTGLGSDSKCKEAVNTAFNYLKANGNRISGSISTSTKDYIINYQDLQGIGMTDKLALPTLIALCSIALGKPVVSNLAVLGDITISGTMIKVDELANTLQVCLDSGAKKVLIPSTSFVDMANKICKIVYFDEDSITDYVQIVAGGSLETTTELLKSSEANEKQEVGANAKGGIGGIFKALVGWEASANGEISAGLALNRNKMVKNIMKNTILTDFLKIVDDDSAKKSASKTARGAIKRFDGYIISAEKDSLSYMVMVSPYLSMLKTGSFVPAGEFSIAIDKLENALKNAKGYYEFVGTKGKSKVILRFNINSFKNGYTISDLLKMNLSIYAIKVGRTSLDMLDVSKELEMDVSIIPKDNPSYEGSNEVEDNAASQKILDVFDVLLAGVEAVD